jgi:hypothetical protein
MTRLPRAGHDLRAGPDPDLGGVLGEGHVAHVVQAVLDRPVPTKEVREPSGLGLAKVRLVIASTVTVMVRHRRVRRSRVLRPTWMTCAACGSPNPLTVTA